MGVQVIGRWVREKKYFFMVKGKAGREKGKNTFSNKRGSLALLPYPFPVYTHLT
jgi:hypothetical protein